MSEPIRITRATVKKKKPKDSDLTFGTVFTDHMFVMDFQEEKGWYDPRIEPYGPLSMDPAAAVLHYAQAVFDGLKAFRGRDGRVRLFRPQKHVDRLIRSSQRLCIPPLEPELALKSLIELVGIEKDWVPSTVGTSLYIRPTIIANFVSTLDGIVAFGGGDLSGGGLISGFHEPDRFVMGLLRALADVVVVGAGTLRGSTEHRWIAEHVHPASAEAFAAWRAAMGLAPRPTTVFVTASGDIPLEHGGLRDRTIPVVIATTPAGAARLPQGALEDHVSIEAVGTSGRVSGEDLAGLGARLGARLILTEGGPHLLGQVVGDDVLGRAVLDRLEASRP